ncbi:MAG: Fur family transcriptional regulator [Phycisphaeraceae bacterium]
MKPETQIGERRTQQRAAILEAIRGAAGPLTVDQIQAAAQRTVANLGIATVYRTVKLLLDHGEIRTVTLPDGQPRYEAADLGHHHHFRCRRCGRVYDLDLCPIALPEGMKLPGGFHVEDHEVTLYGTCPRCSG